jgi:hypothetical protein
MQFQMLHTVLGVEIHIINEQEFSFRFCLVTKKKHTVTIDKTKVIEGTLAEILATIPKQFPVALTLTGKGIIHKNTAYADESNLELLFQSTFPAVDANDFYMQSFAEDKNALVSIIRKHAANDLISKLERSGLKILVVSLGPMVSAHIWRQLNNYTTALAFDTHVFQLNANQQFLSYQNRTPAKIDFMYKIGQEQIAEENILAYATAFQLLLHQQVDMIHADVQEINTNFLHIVQNNWLKHKATIFLLGLLATLTMSYLVFSYYNDQNTNLSQQLGAFSANADQVDVLRKNITENGGLLKQLKWNGGYNYGLLLNEIGESMPRQLQLLELTMNELQAESDTISYVPNIKVTGVTDNLTAVNNWVFVLKQKSWVKSVRLLKFEEAMDTDQYKFNLMLTY